ncbi:hypothetical protein F2Q68_00003398 [Brassica cretica]|uniref:Uncharacterized protein n=1 Tax=Brassica cretica TaxID=69181 RepID=A0A8S9J7P9_BRACR|nr:hypothetical protein F2Q68_00003398 [Brassica cretica]
MSVTTGSHSQPSLQYAVVSIFSVFLDCLSFVKYDCLPYLPFGLSGRVAGSSAPKIISPVSHFHHVSHHGSRSQPSLQVIDLKLYVSILLASMISFECSLVPCSGKLASVRLFAVCSLCSSITPANDSLKLLSLQYAVVSIFSVFLDCLSFVKYDCLPYLPFGLSGRVAGSSAPKIMYASMFVMLKGSSIWCFVASACDAELLIVKSASVAVSITGVRPVLVLSNSQSLSTLLSMIGVEFRGLLGDIRCCLCVIVALIL